MNQCSNGHLRKYQVLFNNKMGGWSAKCPLLTIYWQILTLSRRGEALWPPTMNLFAAMTTLTKLLDFVPFDICQFPKSQFWCLFYENLKKFDGMGLINKRDGSKCLIELWRRKINILSNSKNDANSCRKVQITGSYEQNNPLVLIPNLYPLQ